MYSLLSVVFLNLSKFVFHFSEDSTTSTPKRSGRSKISTKHELPKIAEEKISKSVSSAGSADSKEPKRHKSYSRK